jgi:hypothetical protein
MANSNKHGKQTLSQGIHGTIAYEYDDAPARLAASGFQPEDLYKQAIQLDDNSIWMLINTSPATWIDVGSNPSLVQGISAGTTQANGPTVVFSNANGVSFGANGSTITASVQPSGLAGLIAGTGTATSGTLSFQNGNGVTFGINGLIMTASILPSVGIGAVQGGTQTQTSGTLVFVNSNGMTFGMSNSSQITASYTVPNTVGLISNINVSAGTTSNNLSAITFSNSNNVSFGMNGSIITGSVPDQTSLSFSNLNGLSFGIAGSTLTGSYTVPTQTQYLFSNGNGVTFGTAGSTVTASVNSQTANIFSNSNGISFGTNGSTITASYTVPIQTSLSFSNLNGVSFGLNGSTLTASVQSQTNQTGGQYAIGNTTGQSSSSTFDMRTISISGAGNISVGYSGNALIVSGAGGNGNINISAGTTSNNLNAITFSNSNGVSFGLNGSIITASVSAAPVSLNVSAGTTSNFVSALTFSNANGVSFGLDGSTLTASIPVQTTQTQNIVVPSAGTQTATSGTIIYSNSNNISFGMSGSSRITASYNFNISAGTTSNNLNAVTFSNSNNVSFGANGSTITASASYSQSTAPGAIAAGTQTGTSGTILFSNSNGISFGLSGSTRITASYTVPSTAGLISAINVSAGTTSNNLSAITFSNSNGLAFGLNGSTLTGSYTVPTQTNQTVGLYGLGNTTQNSSTTLDARSLSFNGLGIVTVGYSNGSIQISATQSAQSAQTAGLYALGNTTQNSSTTLDVRSLSFNGLGAATIGYSNGSIQISAPVQTAQTQSLIQAIYDGVNSITTGTIRFSNSNGITFGINGQTITASHNGITSQTNQTQGLYAVGNTTGQSSSSTVDARSITFSGAGAASVGYSSGSVIISVPNALTNINVSAGTTSNNLSAITFNNANGVSFGLDGSTITGSVAAQTNQTVGLYALGNTTQNSSTILDARTLSFNGLGNITVGYSNGSIQISGSQTSQTQNVVVPSAGTQTATSGTVVYSNSNNISFGMSGSSRITASYNFNISAGTTSNNLNAVTFSNINGISFGLDGSTLTASYTVPTQTNQTVGLYALGNTTQNSSTTLDARSLSFNGLGIVTAGYSNGSIQISAVQSNQTAGLYALGNTTQNSSTTLDVRTLSYNGLGAMTVGYSNGSIQLSAPATSSLSATGGASISVNGNTISIGAAFNISAGTTSNNLSAITFSNSNGISFGLNGSTLTASYSQVTLYSYEPYPLNNSDTTVLSANTATSGSASFVPFTLNQYVAAGWINMIQTMSFITNGTSSGQQSLTLSYGIYTRGTGTNSTTLGSITSGSYSIGVTGNNSTYTINQPTTSNNTGYGTGSTTSAGFNISSGYTGAKLIQFPINSTMSPGQYWLGLYQRVSTNSINVGISQSFIGFALSTDIIGGLAPIGSFSSAYTGTGIPSGIGGPWYLGIGNYSSAAQTNLPASVALSAITGSSFSIIPYIRLVSVQT